MQHRFAVCVLLLGTLGALGCGSSVTTAPSTTTAALVDTFTGTVTTNGAVTYAFSTGAGSITATVTTLLPDSTVVIGVSLGVWNGTSCEIVLSDDNATQGSVVLGNASTAGNLCVRISDVGTVTKPETFQIDVSHS